MQPAMATRMELELTSTRPDGSWTWRAAGARQPKGVLDGSILYSGAKVGDVVRAEADVQIDGITILSVVPPRQKAAPDRLEITGPPRDATPGVTTSLVSKGGRRPPGRDRDRDRADGDRGGRGRPRGEGGPGRPSGDRRFGGPGERGREGDRERSRPGGERRDAGRGAGEQGPRGARPGAPGRARPGGEGGRPGRPERERTRSGESAQAAERPGPKRLTPGTRHRDAVLAELPAEQRPIAEQVVRGGLPAVRQAIAGENEKAAAEGRPPVSGESILAIAEELLPRLKTAVWRDRAEAAAQMLDEVSIRDLRSVVAGAEAAARDDETRLLASTIREALERRLDQQRQTWIGEITRNLDEGRVVRALRLSSRPPDPAVRFPADVAVKLTEAAGAALAPDVAPDRWAAVLDAVASSPIRRTVKPAGLPSEAPEELLTTARQTAGRVPALAVLLGLPMPPPPGPARPVPARPPAPRGGARPPRPPRPAPARNPVVAVPPRHPAPEAGPRDSEPTAGTQADGVAGDEGAAAPVASSDVAATDEPPAPGPGALGEPGAPSAPSPEVDAEGQGGGAGPAE